MDWDDMRIALAIARHGSVSAAARALRSTQPTVSRRLQALERRSGVRLFDRQAGGLTPTPLCVGLVESLERMEDGALTVERRIAARDTGLQGAITVTSLDWLGDWVVAPVAAGFGARHPSVTVELLNDWRLFNLSRREADVAFRFGSSGQEDQVERKVADVAYGLYASPGYLEAHGPPDFDAGCAGHAVAALHEGAGRVVFVDWLRALAPAARTVLRANGLSAHLAAAEAGHALAVLPRVMGDARPRLVHVPAPLPGPVRAVRLGVHADLRATPRIRAFIDFAAAELKARAGALNPG
ncbi:LysR family transcriptional regulator [Arenibaculum sp.]|uniref:LysR family transcriptional regulator n=1 Tax=Arenibaculum sp. TaxID=2865862 RepID=UPI002E160280|nr:LysR family transcriptional regulator [Arenibaculum sp.]